VNYVVGVFESRSTAEFTCYALHISGLGDQRIYFVPPEASDDQLGVIPTIATEGPGIGKAIGAVLGAVIGIGLGFGVAAAIEDFVAAAISPVIVELALASVAGIGGLVGGLAAGQKLDDSSSQGMPEDELLLYKDALKRGRCLVIATADNRAETNVLRSALYRHGAETVDAARHQWSLGLCSAEYKTDHRPAPPRSKAAGAAD
jgi:hypothetical protein